MLRKELPWLQFEFFPATDGKADTISDEEVAPTWNTKRNALYGNYEDVFDKGKNLLYSAKQFQDPGVVYKFSPGERGCAHSHRRMWARVAEASAPVLILEDDVQLVFERSCGGTSSGNTFTERLKLAMPEAERKSAEVLYLGWSGFKDGNFLHTKKTRGRKSAVVRKAEYVWTTVAYVLWPAGARKLLERATPLDQPVDNFMAWEAREGRLASYVVLDEGEGSDTYSGGIVAQVDFTGDSDIKKSDGGEQDDDPAEFLAERASAAAGA